MTTYLGVDIGERNYGLAIADGPLATPLPTIKSGDTKRVIAQIVKIISKHSVSTIVLGLPSGKLESFVYKIKKDLESASGLEVLLHSESLSTHDAVYKLREVGAKRKKLKNDHSYAACLILEDYLESII